MPLKSPRFAGDPTLEACLNGRGSLRRGAANPRPAVEKVQRALVDLRIPLPRFGADGQFGGETAGAVSRFQAGRGLTPDGVVGSRTMAALDGAFSSPGQPSPTSPPPGPPSPPPPLQPGIHWGVDTAAKADFELPDKNGRRMKLFDIITQELGMPEFWGRYIFSSSSKGVAGLTKSEANFIFERSGGRCRILLIDNIAGVRFSQGKEVGKADALGALRQCGKGGLDVPGGVVIYADIEPEFQCNSGWFQGWWEVMQQAGRARGGLYVEPGQFGFSRPYRAALLATADIFTKAINPLIFPPDPSNTARLLWSQRPVPFFKKVLGNTDFNGGNFRPTSFAPNEPTFHPRMTVIWQYGGDCLVVPRNANSKIDMNLANEQGFASMWKGGN